MKLILNQKWTSEVFRSHAPARSRSSLLHWIPMFGRDLEPHECHFQESSLIKFSMSLLTSDIDAVGLSVTVLCGKRVNFNQNHVFPEILVIKPKQVVLLSKANHAVLV